MSTSSSSHKVSLLKSSVEALILLGLMALVPWILISDKPFFYYRASEHSKTEILQALFVLCAVAGFWSSFMHRSAERGWLALVAGFFTLMFIREMDYFLDFIFHGAWKYLALIALAVTLFISWNCRDSMRQGMNRYLASDAHAFILIGLAIVIVFSRLFGSSGFLQQVMESNYRVEYRTFIQEGLELLGYIFLCWGSVRFWWRSRRNS